MPLTFEIYNDIGSPGLEMQDFANFFTEANGADVTLLINSAGGSVFVGLGVQNLIEQYEGKVTAKIIGVAASMASGIAATAAYVEMAENALLMIHSPSSVAMGTSGDMERAKSMLERAEASLVAAYANRSKMSEDQVVEAMAKETWYDAKEALAVGLIDAITEPEQVVARFDMPKFLRVPACHVNALANIFNSGKEEQPVPSTQKETPQSATIQELKALNGADKEFCFDCVDKGLTLSEAQNALCQVLIDRAAEADEKRIDAESAAQKAAEQAPPVGHDPVPTNSTEEEDEIPERSALETYNALMKEMMAKHGDPTKAYHAIASSNEELLDRVRQEAN